MQITEMRIQMLLATGARTGDLAHAAGAVADLVHGLDGDAGRVHGNKPSGHGLVGLEIGLCEVACHAEHILCSVGVGAEGLVAVDDDLSPP